MPSRQRARRPRYIQATSFNFYVAHSGASFGLTSRSLQFILEAHLWYESSNSAGPSPVVRCQCRYVGELPSGALIKAT